MNLLAPLATLQAPDEAQMKDRAQRALRMVEAMVIDSPETYSLAAEELQAIKTKADTIEAQRTAITGPINKALKAINDLFRGPKEYLDTAEKTIKGKMLVYKQEQDRIAAEAARRAEEAAAAERRRLEEEARRVREEQEAREREARAEQERIQREADEARQRGDAEAAARAQAEAESRARQAEIDAQNAAAQAAAIEQTAAVITAPVVALAQPKAAGISTAKSWDFEVEDLLKVVQHVAKHPEHVSILMVDSVKLRALVKALGKNLGIDGVRVFEKETMAARRKVAA
jgi:hypothetical protein